MGDGAVLRRASVALAVSVVVGLRGVGQQRAVVLGVGHTVVIAVRFRWGAAVRCGRAIRQGWRHRTIDDESAVGAAGLDPLTGSPTGSVHVVQGTAFHPAYAGASLSDVAVVRIAPSVAPEIATPMVLAATAPQIGQQATFIGFGVAVPGDVTTVGQRRQTMNYVSSVEATTFTFSDNSTETGQACDGDSGGPTLAAVGGATVLLGVQAGANNACTRTIDMRVDVYRPWIENQMALLRGEPAPHPIDPSVPAGAPYGESCTSNANCRTHACITIKTFFKTRHVCSQPCSAATPCPGGDECHSSGYCIANPTEGDRQVESVTPMTSAPEMNGGCAAAGAMPGGDVLPGLALLLLALWVVRRRADGAPISRVRRSPRRRQQRDGRKRA